LSVVASDIFGVSGRAMMAALIAGGRCQVVCVNTSMEVSTDDGCCGIRTWGVGGVWAGV
jgi:hypothetical protein